MRTRGCAARALRGQPAQVVERARDRRRARGSTRARLVEHRVVAVQAEQRLQRLRAPAPESRALSARSVAASLAASAA